MDVAYKFRKNCERSDAILQRFLNPTEDTLSDEYIEQPAEQVFTTRATTPKDSKVVVSSDAGLYEYWPPMGLNVKRVRSEMGTRVMRSATKKGATSNSDSQTIYLKSEPLNEETLDDSECIDVLYDIEPNYDVESSDAERSQDSMQPKISRKNLDPSTSHENDSKIMQIKPVRTNKVRLGHTSSNKGKGTSTSAKGKASESASKENSTTNRSPKTKTNAKGEPKQPKKCEICGNTYMYQHALDR